MLLQQCLHEVCRGVCRIIAATLHASLGNQCPAALTCCTLSGRTHCAVPDKLHKLAPPQREPDDGVQRCSGA